MGTHLKTKAGKQVIVRVDGLKPNLPMNVFLQNFYLARIKILVISKKATSFPNPEFSANIFSRTDIWIKREPELCSNVIEDLAEKKKMGSV